MLSSLRMYTFALAALAVWVAPARSAHLYMLSGLPSASGDFPVRLYGIDATSGGPLALVQEIGEGLSCVLVDYKGRRLVAASPGVTPTNFIFINMNDPTSVVRRRIPYDSAKLLPIGIYLLDIPQTGPGVALTLGRLWTPDHMEYPSGLTFVGVNGPDQPTVLPFADLKYLRYAGFIGGGHFEQEATVGLRGSPLRVLVPKASGTGTGVPLPRYQADPQANYQVVASDEDRMVLAPFLPGESGVVDVFSRASGDWRRVPLPYQHGPVRAFGSWLAMIEERRAAGPAVSGQDGERKAAVESPGTEKRQGEMVDRRASVDDYFAALQAAGKFYPGELALYNLDSGVTLRISTGSGDSEVVLATDEAVFYRVDDELYRRNINGSSLGDAVKLAEGEEIVQVHWAFLN